MGFPFSTSPSGFPSTGGADRLTARRLTSPEPCSTKKAPGYGGPRAFRVAYHRRQLVGAVRFCFAVTLLALWTGKAEFCDPRKITKLCVFLCGVSHFS